ncbi:sensor histidine kinase [Saccharibacillus alkalitolerans]|uniref:histidine kinase n=1 Tax=Saccharibacillus alkalitolerans TaxID=2705290 RepID=A0ABX0F8N6_9BACL|nr:HAMP domain-containing sensor histidine kinase [Saccharibacillus alkalitolerans]NGZ77332.1 HAMP domain-containing histidine kinase [Saccharibacillus alkalitolerans]
MRKNGKKAGTAAKFRHTLMARYLMLVGFAIFLLPLILIVVMFLYLGYIYLVWQPEKADIDSVSFVSAADLEQDWHDLAASLDGASAEEIVRAVESFRESNPLVSVAAVDAKGRTLFEAPRRTDMPDTWTPGRTAEYMKRAAAYNAPNFAVVAFVGEGEDGMRDTRQGFIVAEVPRTLTVSSVPNQNARLPQIVAVSLFVLLFLLFAFMSWAFFYRIRKRLVRLQEAMTAYDEAGIPLPVGPGRRQDEIADLEQTFNAMVRKLREGRDREREEEELRKKLIANLSHDLRTPLTVIRSHAYSLESEPLGERGRESLNLMARKLDDLGGLIDNLLSYTLIAAGRYPMRLEETDVLRLVRTAAAQWYPVFEKEGMEVDADLPEEALVWRVDREWFVRILDNLFQNAVRHAKEGRYIGLSLGPEEEGGLRTLQIRDKGPGIKRTAAAPAADAAGGSARIAEAVQAADTATDGSEERRKPFNPALGAGIGLSIVDLMIREMGMSWTIESGDGGTLVTIRPSPAPERLPE